MADETWYDAKNMGSAFPLLDYGSRKLSNYANNTLGSSQNNSGVPWWMRADRSRYPSPMMPPMLDPSGQMGASNAPLPATVMDNDFNAEWSNTYEVPEKKGMFDNFSGIASALLKKLPRQDPRQVALTELYGGKNNLQGGQTIQSGLMAGYNPVSGGLLDTVTGGKFGDPTNYGLQRAYDKRMGTIEKTLANKYNLSDTQIQDVYAGDLKDEDQYDSALFKRLRKLRADQATELATLQGATEGGAQITDGGNQGGNIGGSGNTGGGYHMSRPTSQGGLGISRQQAQAVSQANKDAGYSSWGGLAQGGRAGYAGGELVDEDINIEGPGFDVNENMEMAEGPSPFEMRIQELVDEGMSWQQAYQIAAQEFGMAEGQEDSFSEEGIASLV